MDGKVAQYTDYYQMDALLSSEERTIRDKVRAFVRQDVIPFIADYWDQAQFPFEMIPRLAELNIAGGMIATHGCPGMNAISCGLATAELAYGDGSLNTFFGVHSGLAMQTLALFGSEEHQRNWLPAMARMEKLGAFALTEPEHGSDAVSLSTQARRVDDTWVLNGQKKWIGNASFADLIIVWARDSAGQVGGFLVEKDTPGLSTTLLKGKTSQRASWQAIVSLKDVTVPMTARLPGVRTFQDTTRILTLSRCSIAWAALGHATACYEYALAYARKRNQFGKALISYQLVQQKLVRMLGEITSLQFLCLRLGQLTDLGQITHGMASLAKMQATLKARQIAADARDLLGGNGILLENHIGRHQADLEALFTYEGTDHMQILIVGREITGVQAIL